MPHSLTLPTIGILALAGAGLGVYLGNDSVSEINPIYFQEPPTRFHADLSPYQSPASAGYDVRVNAAAPIELGGGCVGCRTYPEEYYPVRDPAADGIGAEPQSKPAVQLAALSGAEDSDVVRRRADLDRVQRYAGFAVSAEAETAQASRETETTEAQGTERAAAD